MKFDKYFDEAKKNGIDEYELHVTHNYKLSVEWFRGEISGYHVADTTKIIAKGLVNGKLGIASTEQLDNTAPLYLADTVKQNAICIDSDEKSFIFKGSAKYHKGNTYNKSVSQIPVETKIGYLKTLEEKIKAHEYIADCELSYEEEGEEFTIVNSHDLKLVQKSNSCVIFAQVIARKGDENKTHFEAYFNNTLDKLDLDDLANKAVAKAVSQFGGEPCASGKYKCVLDRDVVSTLLGAFLGSIKADNVQKKSSVLADKLGQPVMAKCLTVKELPLTKDVFFRYFDDEGVALENKTLINKGVLQTFVYNLQAAAKENKESTGNGFGNGIGFNHITVTPGKKSLEELFEEIGNGIYITNVQGAHSGLNANSGNFSLQAQGYLIKNGKQSTPVNLITIADNLFNLFMNVKAVANDNKLSFNSFDVPSLYIKEIAVSGK